jgi:uncharacterized protein (DUF433 family)
MTITRKGTETGLSSGRPNCIRSLYDRSMQHHPERDWSGCSIVQFNPAKLGGAPTVRGRRITPDAFVDNFNSSEGYSPEFIACELFEEPLEDVQTILKYAEEHGWLLPPKNRPRNP